MGELQHWNPHGIVEVYEAKHAIAVGNKQRGYSVFGNKGSLKIHNDGKMTYRNSAGSMGSYTKKEAVMLVNRIERLLSKPHDSCVIPMEGNLLTEFWLYDPKTEGKVLVASEGDYIGVAHELGHEKAGHLTRKGIRTGTKLSKEKEAITQQIELMKEDHKFNTRDIPKIARPFSTYLRGSKNTRYKRALKIVRDISKGTPATSRTIK